LTREGTVHREFVLGAGFGTGPPTASMVSPLQRRINPPIDATNTQLFYADLGWSM
jgi:hypothetical protein